MGALQGGCQRGWGRVCRGAWKDILTSIQHGTQQGYIIGELFCKAIIRRQQFSVSPCTVRDLKLTVHCGILESSG